MINLLNNNKVFKELMQMKKSVLVGSPMARLSKRVLQGNYFD